MHEEVGQTNIYMKGRKFDSNIYRGCHQKELPRNCILSVDRKTKKKKDRCLRTERANKLNPCRR
jgi:hypothetical protein